MRILCVAVVVLAASGCQDFEDALNVERAPVSPPGILPADQMQEPAAPVPAAPAGAAPADGGAAAPAAAPKTGIIGKTTARIVDKQAAMAENPSLVVVENKVSGSDPITVAGSAYISMTSRTSALNFQHGIDLYKATNDRHPSFDELQQMMKQHGVRLTELPPYQMYGYDQQTGAIVILEDKADKARRYEEAGIPLE